MSYATRLLFVLASLSSCHDDVRNRLEKLLDERKDNFESIVLKFVAEQVTPTSTFHFEQRIGEEARELARLLIEDVYNALEPDDPDDAPHDVSYQGGGYRRLNHKTANRHVADRDGISLCEYHYRCFEVATSGTVTVYDRAGKRLGSVYLAFPPELGQDEMTRELTGLVEEVLRRWQRPLPRLAYVTDAGESETGYYQRVLRSMRHPRTGERLHWYRIVDYFHASERIWKMAHALFGRNETAARAWALRMCKLLKKPNGPSRVLHSAAAIRARVTMSATRADEYRKASNYIRQRTTYMQYAEYKRLHLPIGSGVTEAACKTIFTQRLKLSGMRWTNNGARTILTLRVIKLSRIWDAVHASVLAAKGADEIRVYEPKQTSQLQNAA